MQHTTSMRIGEHTPTRQDMLCSLTRASVKAGFTFLPTILKESQSQLAVIILRMPITRMTTEKLSKLRKPSHVKEVTKQWQHRYPILYCICILGISKVMYVAVSLATLAMAVLLGTQLSTITTCQTRSIKVPPYLGKKATNLSLLSLMLPTNRIVTT